MSTYEEYRGVFETTYLRSADKIPNFERRGWGYVDPIVNARWQSWSAAITHLQTLFPPVLATIAPGTSAKELQKLAEEEVERLKASGWKLTDFARALENMLEDSPAAADPGAAPIDPSGVELLTDEELQFYTTDIPHTTKVGWLRAFLRRAMTDIQIKKTAPPPGLQIRGPFPIHDIEQATGMVFPDLLKREPFVLIDTETTGMDDDPAAKLIEIGMVKVANGMVWEFDTLINPGIPIPPASSAVHHITDAMVATAPTEAKIQQYVRDFIGDALPVAHSARFDSTFVNPLVQRPHSREGHGCNEWLCTLRLARHLLPEVGHGNSFLRYYFKTNPKSAGLGPHRAIDDVYVSLENLKALVNLADTSLGADKPPSLAALRDFANRPMDYPTMTYGKYGPDEETGKPGLPLANVPLDYFEWLRGNDKRYKKDWDVRQAIDAEMSRRRPGAQADPSKPAGNEPNAPIVPLTVCNFGKKHNGKPVSAIDDGYINWCLTNDGVSLRLSPEMRLGFEQERQARAKAAENLPKTPPPVDSGATPAEPAAAENAAPPATDSDAHAAARRAKP